jgi:hypothetical protein
MGHQQNNFGAATPIGSAMKQLATQLFAPKGNAWDGDLAQSKIDLNNAQAAAVGNTSLLESEESWEASDAKDLMGNALQNAYAPLQVQAAPTDSFTGPMPMQTRQEQVYKNLPDIISGAYGSGTDGKDLGDMMRAIIQNSGIHGMSDGAMLGAGDQFKTQGGAVVNSMADMERFTDSEYGQETSVHNADNASSERENNVTTQGGITENNDTIAGNMAELMAEQQFKIDHPEDFTLSDGGIRYDSKGNEIASNAKDFASNLKPLILKPGDRAITHDGKEIGQGNEVAADPVEPLVLKPGEIAYNSEGKVLAKGADIPGKEPVNRVVSPGQSVVDSTGKAIYTADPKTAPAGKPMKVEPGQSVVDSTGKVIYTAPAAPAEPLSASDQLSIAKQVRTILTDGGGKFGRAAPPDAMAIIGAAISEASKTGDIGTAMANAVNNGGYTYTAPVEAVDNWGWNDDIEAAPAAWVPNAPVQPQTVTPEGPPPPDQRVIGQVYQSPNGPMMWTATGWVGA